MISEVKKIENIKLHIPSVNVLVKLFQSNRTIYNYFSKLKIINFVKSENLEYCNLSTFVSNKCITLRHPPSWSRLSVEINKNRNFQQITEEYNNQVEKAYRRIHSKIKKNFDLILVASEIPFYLNKTKLKKNEIPYENSEAPQLTPLPIPTSSESIFCPYEK